MALEHSDQYFKVVSVKSGPRSGKGWSGQPHSALLRNSPHNIDYTLAVSNGKAANHFVAPRTNGTPVLLYNDLDLARAFTQGDLGYRRLYRAEVYGEVMVPAKVLKLNLGWSQLVEAFWRDVLAGADLSQYPTRNAPPGTVALFGVVRLLEAIPVIN